MSSFPNSTPNFDNLLIQSLMRRLQISSPPPLPAAVAHHQPPSSQSLEELLFDAMNNMSDVDDDDADQHDGTVSNRKSYLAKEEAKLEREVIRIIHAGNYDSLRPNSGQAVTIGEHYICVSFQEEESEYRVWEWHGHIMMFDDENGYSPEYIYGNYFERLDGYPLRRVQVAARVNKDEEGEPEKEEEQVGNLGLRELIDGGESGGAARILHRNANARSSSHK